ncbi:hypothetical protein T492DRAFT_1005802 [Pavlovales sp. CCMP2436]|nr:hypothetical protein T492DRAFT_1005802 [Pavlovales sp. CCMP2436]
MAILRTRALAVFALEYMPGFVDDNARYWSTTLPLAAYVGCVGVLEELVDNRQCELTAYASTAAAGKGHLDALTWLHSRGCPWDTNVDWPCNTCRSAAAGGHLEVLRYAHEHGCQWDDDACEVAAEGGHLDLLQYAHEHGCPWDNHTCWCAAEGGYLEVLRYALDVLRYAHEHGCEWDGETCSYAAEEGHLEVLRYAYENGCPLQVCLAKAVAGGHAAVVEYLRACTAE